MKNAPVWRAIALTATLGGLAAAPAALAAAPAAAEAAAAERPTAAQALYSCVDEQHQALVVNALRNGAVIGWADVPTACAERR